MKDQLTALARELGFEACAFASVSPVHQEGNIHPVAASLSGDARSILPDAGCILNPRQECSCKLGLAARLCAAVCSRATPLGWQQAC